MGLTWQERAAARARGANGRKLRWKRWAALSVAGLVAATVPALPSGANHTTVAPLSGVFESNDANLDVDHASPSVDWNSFTNTTTASAWRFTKVTGPQERIGNPDDIYNGGVKQDKNCPTTKDGSLGSGSGKIDLSRIYLAHKKLDTPDANDPAGTQHDYLFIAWARVDGSDAASSHVGYEFNTDPTPDPCVAGDPNGLINRVAGDRLFVFDFSGGDADSTVKIRTWITSGTCEVHNVNPPCWGPPQAAVFDGDVNSASSVDDDIVGDTLGLVQFGEAAIDLTASGIDPCQLNGRVTGVSRSSGDSGSAQMKDKVGPTPFSLPGCTQATNITTKVRMTDTATINGFDSTFVGDHTGTLTFDLYGPDGSSSNCSGGTGNVGVNPVFTSVHSSVATNNFVASGFYEVTATGTYRWRVRYTGDSANLPSDTGCNAEVVTINYQF